MKSENTVLEFLRHKLRPNTAPFAALRGRSNRLDLGHKRLDVGLFAAYGWKADLSDEEILEKLLALNLERAT
jgi:hypothetical protein